MSNADHKKPTIVELAERIEKDIRERGLQPGDPYLGQVETTKLLGVGTGTANRALQLLSQRGVLERKKRKGTFIGNLEAYREKNSMRRVHMVMPHDFLKNEGFFADGHILGIQGELPTAEIVFNFLPDGKQEAVFVQGLVDEATSMKGLHGFVLASSTFTTQKIMEDSGLPAVVGGSLYPSIGSLPSLDYDHKLEAKLIADYLLSLGCRRFLILGRVRTLPGEQVFFDTLSELLGEAEMKCSEVIVRNLPNDPNEIKASVETLLTGVHKGIGKLGVVARNEVLADGFLSAASEVGWKAVEDFGLVAANIHKNTLAQLRNYSYIQVTCTPQERGKMIGQMLKRITKDGVVASKVIPVELVVP